MKKIKKEHKAFVLGMIVSGVLVGSAWFVPEKWRIMIVTVKTAFTTL